MKQNKLLTIREVSEELGVTEQDVIDLAETGKIPAYKIGGVYLRFKSEHVVAAKQKVPKSAQTKDSTTLLEKTHDFFYFNDFYLLSAVIIVAMLFIILRT